MRFSKLALAFINHQFHIRQDILVDILIKSVQSVRNTANKNLTTTEKLSRSERRAAVRHLTKTSKDSRALIDKITEVVKSPLLTSDGKVVKIEELIEKYHQQQDEKEQQKIEMFENSLERMSKNQDYYDILEKLSNKLQRRVTGIVKVLEFNEETSDPSLIKAIQKFKERDGNVTHASPTGFLEEDEKENLTNNAKKFRSSLYKALLFFHIVDGIRSGNLNLKYSYCYKAISEYLIDKSIWEKQKSELLKLAGLSKFTDFKAVIDDLKARLNDKYKTANKRFSDGRNPYLSIDREGKVSVTTPAVENNDTKHIGALLSGAGYVPILQVLSDINNITGFTKQLRHYNVKNIRTKPRSLAFFAGLIGKGCNIGIHKISKISVGVNENTLSNIVNWHFSLKNLQTANNQIVEMITRLSLSDAFLQNKLQLHASSDGRKIGLAVDSLLANYSFKYFGKDKGVSIYTFIDERQALFYATVISASEREAAYVIDGLLQNDVVKVDIHSTDSHGYTELIFAGTHFLDVSFAPRIKNIGKQTTYSFSSKKTYEKRGYKILPSDPVPLVRTLIYESYAVSQKH